MRRIAVVFSILAVLAGALGGQAAAARQPATPDASPAPELTLLPPDAPAFGRSYGEWAAAWSRWFLAHPGAADDCGEGQRGDVWFLPGVPANAPDLTGLEVVCEIPAGLGVLLPVYVGPDADAATCEANTERGLAGFGGLEAVRVALNGREIPDLAPYNAPSTPLNPPATPGGSPAASPVGGAGAVACGYMLLLAPPPTGEHTYRLTIGPDAEPIADITWSFTVAPSD